MSGVIDTNLLLYAVNKDAPEHARALEFLTSSLTSNNAWYLTDGIIYEFLRVSTHPKVFAHPLRSNQAFALIEALRMRDSMTILTLGAEHW